MCSPTASPLVEPFPVPEDVLGETWILLADSELEPNAEAVLGDVCSGVEFESPLPEEEAVLGDV